MAEYLIQDTTLDAIADAINAKTGGSSAMTPAEMVTAIGSIQTGGGGGGAQTLTKLAEYAVTDPIHAISISATEQMQQCDVLYVMASLNFDASDWMYVSVNTATIAGTAYFAQAASVNDIALILLSKQVTINGATKPARFFIYTDTKSTSGTLSNGTLSNILLSLYTTGHNFTSGSVEIWGYV